MTREFIYTEPFRRAWGAMGLNDEDIKELELILLKNPHDGDVIQGTGGARKMRITLEAHGKRGGARVIYLDVYEKEKLYLLFVYPKSAVRSDKRTEKSYQKSYRTYQKGVKFYVRKNFQIFIVNGRK